MKYPWQEEIWERLLATLERLPHALLLHGPPGVGKRALAEHFMQRLLCEGAAGRPEPCGVCDACRWFLAGHHPDARFLEPEAIARRPSLPDEETAGSARSGKPSVEIKVDQVRELADFLNVGSHRAARRVVLVHPAEDMNASAANALLKGLEEPPAGAIFILVTHRPARLLATIRSRCVPVPAALPPEHAARAWLEKDGGADAGRWLRFAGGAPLRALEYARGERGAALLRVLQALAARDGSALRGCADREEIDVLAEALHKVAIDQSFAKLTGRGKYGTPAIPGGIGAEAWLACARRLARHRALIRHPLNPRLFAAELLAAFPRDAWR